MDIWYQKAFGTYYTLVYKHRSYEEADKFVINLIKTLISKKSVILDIGCGQGRHVESFLKNEHSCYGIDLSFHLLKTANEKDNLCLGDMRYLPFKDNYFDVCTSLFTSFGYFEDFNAHLLLLKEWFRKLKPNGKLIIDFFNPTLIQNKDGHITNEQIDNYSIYAKRWIENGRINKHVRISLENNIIEEYTESVLVLSQQNFTDLFDGAGFKNTTFLAEDLTPFNPKTSNRMVVVGEK